MKFQNSLFIWHLPPHHLQPSLCKSFLIIGRSEKFQMCVNVGMLQWKQLSIIATNRNSQKKFQSYYVRYFLILYHLRQCKCFLVLSNIKAAIVYFHLQLILRYLLRSLYWHENMASIWLMITHKQTNGINTW